MRASPGDNLCVEKKSSSSPAAAPVKTRDPFLPGTLVIVNLGDPREKFWGMILAIAPAGISLSGADLASFEDIAAMAREGEPFHPAIVFFPMHRIERVVLDVPDGSLSSLSQRFFAKTGLEPIAALSDHLEDIHVQLDSKRHAPKERA
jgi:hypothetical protein